jgi:hypothetical protein
MVSYEIDCSPYNESCFVGCEDEDCISEYYYSVVTRHASEIEKLCGQDITNCSEAESCAIGESQCTLSSCIPEQDECDNINEQTNTLINNSNNI